MNRRSVLRWLGFAPVAAPAAVAAASAPKPAEVTIVDRRTIGDYRIEMRSDGSPRIVSLRSDEHSRAWDRKMSEVSTLDISHPNLPGGVARVTSEQTARVSADTKAASFVGSVFSRPL